MPQRVLAEALARATGFSEVGAAVCGHLRTRLGAVQSVVMQFAGPRRFAMLVDDVPVGANDALRLAIARGHLIDPHLDHVLATESAFGGDADAAEFHAAAVAAGYTGPMMAARTLPLIGATGLVGAIRTGTHESLRPALCRELDVVAAYAAARLAELGVSAATGGPPFGPGLTARQRLVAERASEGLTNGEIAGELALSVNTVKKHLKDVFERLAVTNRTELARLRARTCCADRAPVGVSKVAGSTVTRLAPDEVR